MYLACCSSSGHLRFCTKSTADRHESIKSVIDELCMSSPSGSNLSALIADRTHSLVFASALSSHAVTYDPNQPSRSIGSGSSGLHMSCFFFRSSTPR